MMPKYKVAWSCRYVGTTEVEADSLMDAVESFIPDPLNQTSENVYKVRSVAIIDKEVVNRDNLDSFNEDNSIRRADALKDSDYIDCEEIEPSTPDPEDINGNYNDWTIKERKSTPYYP
tara:strand:+ start:1053 stop:1406 length:354 start_codon:yes stop_codon:yes gene_type:complete